MAIVALIKSINPALVDLRENLSSDPRRNIQLAFEIAHRCLDIPPLLESEGTWTKDISIDSVRMKMCVPTASVVPWKTTFFSFVHRFVVRFSGRAVHHHLRVHVSQTLLDHRGSYALSNRRNTSEW